MILNIAWTLSQLLAQGSSISNYILFCKFCYIFLWMYYLYLARFLAFAEIKSMYHEKNNVEKDVRVIVANLIAMSKNLCSNIILKYCIISTYFY